MTTHADELLTIGEAAAVLRMSKTSFRRRLELGEITVIRDRRHVLVRRSALTDYLERHTVNPSTRQRAAATATATARRRAAPAAPAGRVKHLWEADA